MLRTLLVTGLLLGIALAGVPGVAAKPDDPQCIIQCDWKEQVVRDVLALAKALGHDLDPREWPCTCDPVE